MRAVTSTSSRTSGTLLSPVCRSWSRTERSPAPGLSSLNLWSAAALLPLFLSALLRGKPVRQRHYALFLAACGAEKPFGSSAVDKSTPERSAPVKSVSLKIATPISAPENRAPVTMAPLKFTFLKRARSKQAFERSHRKNSTPLACASVRSAQIGRAHV